ncbi:MAG: hypothetical protein AB1502_01780 [Thermodesulfobacteriota bacterium]
MAKDLLKKDIYLVLGGFHLAGFDNKETKKIIGQFRDLGVRKVGPSHCSGDGARQLFAKEYEDDFIWLGAGAKVKINSSLILCKEDNEKRQSD